MVCIHVCTPENFLVEYALACQSCGSRGCISPRFACKFGTCSRWSVASAPESSCQPALFCPLLWGQCSPTYGSNGLSLYIYFYIIYTVNEYIITRSNTKGYRRYLELDLATEFRRFLFFLLQSAVTGWQAGPGPWRIVRPEQENCSFGTAEWLTSIRWQRWSIPRPSRLGRWLANRFRRWICRDCIGEKCQATWWNRRLL